MPRRKLSLRGLLLLQLKSNSQEVLLHQSQRQPHLKSNYHLQSQSLSLLMKNFPSKSRTEKISKTQL